MYGDTSFQIVAAFYSRETIATSAINSDSSVTRPIPATIYKRRRNTCAWAVVDGFVNRLDNHIAKCSEIKLHVPVWNSCSRLIISLVCDLYYTKYTIRLFSDYLWIPNMLYRSGTNHVQVTNHENNTKQRNQLALKIYIATKIGSPIRHNLDEKLQILQEATCCNVYAKTVISERTGANKATSRQMKQHISQQNSHQIDERHIKCGPGRSPPLPSDAWLRLHAPCVLLPGRTVGLLHTGPAPKRRIDPSTCNLRCSIDCWMLH